MCVVTLSHDLSYDVCVCRGDPCTWTVHVHPLCQSYYGCSNGTVTKHGSTGHPSTYHTSFTVRFARWEFTESKINLQAAS